MQIEQFFLKSVGEWNSMRSGHSLAFQEFEEIRSKIKITPAKCKFPLEGEVSIEKSNGKSGVLNFGLGDCDSEATLTLSNGKVKTVDLEKRRCKS